MPIIIPSHTSCSQRPLCPSTIGDHQGADARHAAFSSVEANGNRLDATLDDEHTQLISALLMPSSGDNVYRMHGSGNAIEEDGGLQLSDIHELEASSFASKAATIAYSNAQPASGGSAIRSFPMHHYAFYPASTAAVPLQHHRSSKAVLRKQRAAPSVSSTIKQCANCGATNTPTWRRCPDGKLLLCNACGLYIKNHMAHRKVVRAPDGQLRAARMANSEENAAGKRQCKGSSNSSDDECGGDKGKRAKKEPSAVAAACALRHHGIIQSISSARRPAAISQAGGTGAVWLPCAHCTVVPLPSLHTPVMMQQRGTSVICDACRASPIGAVAFLNSPSNGGAPMMNGMVGHSGSGTARMAHKRQQWRQMLQQATNSFVHEILGSSDGEESDPLADIPAVKDA